MAQAHKLRGRGKQRGLTFMHSVRVSAECEQLHGIPYHLKVKLVRERKQDKVQG